MPKTLYLMMGYPGAGKTTAAEIIAEHSGAVHLSSDLFHKAVFPKQTFSKEEHDIRYRSLDYFTELLLSSGIGVVYDANLNRKIHRQQKYKICEKLNVKPILVWVDAPLEVSRKRATEEAEQDNRRPYGNLEVSVFERIASEIEMPSDDEPLIKLDGQSISKEYVAEKLNL